MDQTADNPTENICANVNGSEELLREIQKGLLNWYHFTPGSNVLYIGEEDVYFHMLLELSLNVVKVSIEQTVCEEWKKGQGERFDYIIAIKVLETQPNPGEFLKAWESLLVPDGILLLGMNNRFGLKYFCGDRDPYTDRNFDGIEGYKRAYLKEEDGFKGRCYSREEIRDMLSLAGWEKIQFFSVLSDLDNPRLIYGENFLPNEDLSNRLFPTYHYPKSVFLEEESLYNGLIKNGMFHQMANAYLAECSPKGELCDVIHVTSSMERGREDALLTIIHRSGIVEKRAAYKEGKARLHKLLSHGQDLAAHGIQVVDARMEEDVYVMAYVEEESGQLYLKGLLRSDQQRFLAEMDHFRDLILGSSELIKPDQGDGEGAILKKGYLDMVPLNSFYVNGTFVFYDQEFCEENYPANEIIWRMVATFYAGDGEAERLLPRDQLLVRYGLMKKLEKWQKMEWSFLEKLRKEKELRLYHEKCRRSEAVVNANRWRMNYSADEYQKMFFDIFQDLDSGELILFGAGRFARRFLDSYGQEYPVYAVVDNNQEMWGKEIGGIPVHSPKILKELESREYKVMICIQNYLPVMKQLDEMGIEGYRIYNSGRDYPRAYRSSCSSGAGALRTIRVQNGQGAEN